MLLKKNPLFVYESLYVESVELFYKICRGAQRGPCQNIDFIYPGKKKNKNTVYGKNQDYLHCIFQEQNGADPAILLKIILT